jgi:hypothetical protein
MANINTGNFANFLEGMAEHLDTGLANRQKKAIYTQYMEMKDTNRIVERDVDFEGMAALTDHVEGSPISELDAKEGYPQAYTQHQFAGLIDITRPMEKFSQVNLVEKLVQKLMDAAYKAKEIIGTDYLEYGNTAVASVPQVNGRPIINSVQGNGQLIFAQAQLWKSGGPSYDTLSASADSLSETSIDTAWIDVRRWVDDKGAPLDVKLVGLIIPPNLFSAASKTMFSDLEPDTANNAINVAPKQLRRRIIENQWLSSTSIWYLMTDAREGSLCWWKGWDDQVETNKPNPRTGNRCISVEFSCATGVNRNLKLYKVA